MTPTCLEINSFLCYSLLLMNVSSYDFTKCVNCSHVSELSKNTLMDYTYGSYANIFYQDIKTLKFINKYKAITKHTYTRES